MTNNLIDLNEVFAQKNTLRKEAQTLQNASNESIQPEDIIGASLPTAALISRLLNAEHFSLQ